MTHRMKALSPLLAAAFACAIAVTGCAARPARETLAAIKPVDAYASENSFAATPGRWPVNAWWKAYGDPQLDALIDEGLAGAPSIASAEARLRRARAMIAVAGAANRPQISANGSATEQRQSYNYLSPPAFTPPGWNDYSRASLDLSWELDFWGKNRAGLAAATSDAEAAAADAAQARLALATAIASAYADLARNYADRDTSAAARDVRVKTADLFRRRYENGLETLAGLRQVEARRASAEYDLLSSEEQIGLQKNRIAVLMGAGPDRGQAIARPAVDIHRVFALPERLGADLIGRRPDIVAARLRAESAAKRVRQSEAAFYPNVNLAAFIGLQSLGLNMLTDGNSMIGSAGPAISLPIFTGGRLRGQLSGARADYGDAVAIYEHTVVQALGDVADAAVSQKALSAEISKADEAVDAARAAWRSTNDRYSGALSTYIEVLSAEDNLLSTLRVQTDLKSRSFTLDVALVRALGGGYSTSLN